MRAGDAGGDNDGERDVGADDVRVDSEGDDQGARREIANHAI
jgi:hypothetical protein